MPLRASMRASYPAPWRCRPRRRRVAWKFRDIVGSSRRNSEGENGSLPLSCRIVSCRVVSLVVSSPPYLPCPLHPGCYRHVAAELGSLWSWSCWWTSCCEKMEEEERKERNNRCRTKEQKSCREHLPGPGEHEGKGRASAPVTTSCFIYSIHLCFIFFSLLRSRSACRLRERMELRFKRHQR